MSRYIEIIFDDSGSMTTYIDGKPKYDIAKQMFNDNVLPQLGKKGDELILRTLRKGCAGISKETQFFSKNKLKVDRADKLSRLWRMKVNIAIIIAISFIA